MEVFGPDHGPISGRSAVTIGAYDGVHLGHRALLAELQRQAEAGGMATAVVTFDRHPASVVRPESVPLLLTDLDLKLELLASCGIDRVLVVPFDQKRAEESPEAFVRDVLVDHLRAGLVVVGQDFHFGHGRRGNVALLADLGRIHGFAVEGIDLRAEHGDPISSTRIRALLAAGEVTEAAALLGRPHRVRGPVVRGDGRGGASLGFPTANVAVPDEIAMPADGIYAGWYRHPDGTCHGAAISVGRRPTFYEKAGPPVLEAFLLDFDGDLYGQAADVSFVARLREERRFESADELVAQMHRDVADARSCLAG